jgi:hypothetical protein
MSNSESIRKESSRSAMGARNRDATFLQIPPTPLVDSSGSAYMRSSNAIWFFPTPSPNSIRIWRGSGEVELAKNHGAVTVECRPSVNEPPTALVGFEKTAACGDRYGDRYHVQR